LLLGAAIVTTLPACDVSSPERFIRAPIIRSFSPDKPSFVALTGDTIVFSVSALDPEEGPLRFDFVLGDSVVSGESSWTYVVDDTGRVEVLGRVYNRVSRSLVTWAMDRIAPVNKPPVVVDYHPPDLKPESGRDGRESDWMLDDGRGSRGPASHLYLHSG
jgi:hypothetical protein